MPRRACVRPTSCPVRVEAVCVEGRGRQMTQRRKCSAGISPSNRRAHQQCVRARLVAAVIGVMRAQLSPAARNMLLVLQLFKGTFRAT